MNWISQHIPHCISVVATGAAIVFKVNHVIDASKRIIHSSILQLAWAALRGKPCLKQAEQPETPATSTGGSDMSLATFWESFVADLKDIEPILDKVLGVATKLAPVAEVVETATGNGALVPITQTVAGLVQTADTAVQADEAAGSTGSTLVSGAASVASAVARSGLVNDKATSQITSDTATVQAVAPVVTAAAEEATVGYQVQG